MENTIGGRTIADFKSGCLKIKSMGIPTARANFPSTPRDCLTVPISLRTREAGRDKQDGDDRRVRGLKLERPDANPALRAVHLSTDAGHQDQDQGNEAGCVDPMRNTQPELVVYRGRL